MKWAVLVVGWLLLSPAVAQDFDYESIAKRYPNAALNNAAVENARMQGECLVGLKELNFRRQDQFDPIAEWSSFRSSSLLEQFPPCHVLIMMRTAQDQLRKAEN